MQQWDPHTLETKTFQHSLIKPSSFINYERLPMNKLGGERVLILISLCFSINKQTEPIQSKEGSLMYLVFARHITLTYILTQIYLSHFMLRFDQI